MTKAQTMKNIFLMIAMTIALAIVPVLSAQAVSYDGQTIEAGQDGKFKVNVEAGDNVTLGTTGIKLQFVNAATGATITVTPSSTRPAEATVDAPGVVGTYYDVNLSGVTNADIGTTTWTFTVTDAFLNDNALTTENIFLQHWNGSDWEQLTTRFVSTAGGVHTFEADVNSFSPFAVTGVAGLSNTGSPIVLNLVIASGIIVLLGTMYSLSKRTN